MLPSKLGLNYLTQSSVLGKVFYFRLYLESKIPIRNVNSFNNRVIEAMTKVIMPITIEIISISVISAALLVSTVPKDV